MKTENKKAVLGVAVGLLLFYLTVRVLKKKEQNSQPKITDETINIAALAYMEACHAGEPETKLTQINDELANLYGLKVNTADGVSFLVCDLNGKAVKTITNQ